MRSISFGILMLTTLAGCTVGPKYERPQVKGTDNANWTSPANADAVELEPWREMGDPLLVELVERAIAANPELHIADAQLREARAGRDATAGGRLPELSAGIAVNRDELSKNGQLPLGNLPGFDRRFSLFDAGFDASWEIDLWGRNRRAVEAANHRLTAVGYQRSEVRLRIVAEVARTYAELRGAQAEEHILHAEADTQRQLATLVRQRFDSGEAARLDDVRADAQARVAMAAVPGVQASIRAAANTLALLTGQPPEALLDRLLTPAPLPSLPALVTAGMRSDMLRRRPDIVAAESQLAAATADIGIATADLFPRLALVGSVGQQARQLNDLSSGESTRFQIGPVLHWPIFSGGRIRAQIRAANARADIAAAKYEQAVLGALADSETSLNRYDAALATASELAIARNRSEIALKLAEQRYQAGEDDMLMLLEARSHFHAAERAATRAELEALQSHAALVKALGGGWDEKPATLDR